MEEVSIIGLDLAKNVFQAHGARADGSTSFRKKISRAKVLSFFASVPKCVVAMEACASSHHWARQIGALGHEVRLIAPIYVKPFVKRNKNDAADAEAIAEAASRPTMRFVAVKSAEKQASGMAFKTRDLLVRQRTQTINALRGHMAEYGVVAPNGPVHIERLAEALQDSGSGLPAAVVALSQILLAHIGALTEQIGLLDRELRERARHDQTAKRLDDNSWRRRHLRRRDGSPRAAPGGFCEGARLCRLARPHAPAKLLRGQDAPGRNFEDGSARSPAIADQRSDDRRSMGFAQRRSRGVLARAHVEEKAPPCRRGGAGKSHSPDRMGADDKGRGLSSS